jgi:hypothetical protein
MTTEPEADAFEDVLEDARGFVERARAVFELLHGNLVDPEEMPLNPAAASDAYLDGVHAFREAIRHLDALRRFGETAATG